MKRDVVRDFLNLPGIVGIALVDGRSRPFFFGIDQTLNFQQKEALAQGIQQVIETTPSSFEFFEFQFSGHQVYIYKLEHGIILLVLTNEQLVYSSYSPLVSQLKEGLQEDLSNAIANFRLVAGNVTLSGQSYWKRQSDPSASTLSTGLSIGSGETTTAPNSQPPAEPQSSTSASASTPATARNQPNGRRPPSSTLGQRPAAAQGKAPPTAPSPSPKSGSPRSPTQPNTPAPSSWSPSSPSAATPASSANSKAPTPAQAKTNSSSNPVNNQGKVSRQPAARDAGSKAPAPSAAPSGSATNRSNNRPTSATPPSSSSTTQPPDSPSAPQNSSLPQQKPADSARQPVKSGNIDNAQAQPDRPVTLKEILEALNQLSKLTTRYLGTTIVANYWKSSRPPVEWLANFEVDRSGTIQFAGPMTPGSPVILSSAQHQLLRDWVAAFIQRCSRVIRDFSKIIQKMELDARQRSLLLSGDSS